MLQYPIINQYNTGSLIFPESSFTACYFNDYKSWTPFPAPSATTITKCLFFFN